MKNLVSTRTSLIVAALLVLPFAAQSQAAMSKADYGAAKTRLDAQYAADKAGCSAHTGNAKDVCLEEAKGKERVALADLEYRYTGKADDRNKVRVAQAESTYAIAKERCDDLNGNPKDVCVTEAKAVETKALAEAKLSQEVGKAEKDAGAEMREADRKVAIEKCDAMTGDAKTGCVSAAEAKFPK